MMHNRAGRKLRRTTSHRLAMFSNQLASLMTHERIQTTLTKAKELRPLAERLITAAKSDGVAARRKVAQWIPDRSTVKKVFEKIAPRFVDRPGGYTRILRLERASETARRRRFSSSWITASSPRRKRQGRNRFPTEPGEPPADGSKRCASRSRRLRRESKRKRRPLRRSL